MSDEKLEDLLAELMFAGGKFMVRVRDEAGTKDDGKIWGNGWMVSGWEMTRKKGRTGRCHEILV